MEKGIETSEFRIAAIRQHSIEAFTVQLRLFGQLCNPALRFGDVPQCEQEQFGIIFLQRRV